MNLAEHQQKLLGLIKSTYEVTGDDDPYLKDVAQSENLSITQDVVHFWRSLGIERFCVLTSRLLKRRGLYDQTVSSFIRTRNFSPYIEKLGNEFVDMMGDSDDPLIASVARFEAALIKVRYGDAERHIISWSHEPYAVLASLLENVPLDEQRSAGRYQTIVSRELPRHFEVVPL